MFVMAVFIYYYAKFCDPIPIEKQKTPYQAFSLKKYKHYFAVLQCFTVHMYYTASQFIMISVTSYDG